MKRIKNFRLATQGITALLLFGSAFAATGAEQMMRALPAPAAASPAVQSTAVAAPAGMPPVARPPAPLNKPMSQTGSQNAPIQMKLAPPSQGGGMALLTPAAACGMDPAPRITNINGTQFGIEFQPGSQLNIAGCGFGKGGQVYLSGVGTTVQLKIDSWDDSNIHAHIDASLGGVSDFDGVKVNIKPNGLPIISSIETNKFKAARVQFVLAIPPTVAGTYSQIYGPPKTSNMNVFTTVSREKYYSKYCPAVSDQPSQMTDSWPVDFLANGFDVIGVNYTNHTLQTNWNTQKVQWVLVGGDPGSAKYDAMQKRVVVTFQANSMYVKNAGTLEAIVLPIELIHNLMDSGSACTSSYTVSLTVSGPRGISPLK